MSVVSVQGNLQIGRKPFSSPATETNLYWWCATMFMSKLDPRTHFRLLYKYVSDLYIVLFLYFQRDLNLLQNISRFLD